MSQEQTVFSQILQFVSYDDFRICVQRYDGNKGVRRFSCWEQFLAMAFAQLTHRESLISKCVWPHIRKISTAPVSVLWSNAPLWPTPTRIAIGESIPISLTV